MPVLSHFISFPSTRRSSSRSCFFSPGFVPFHCRRFVQPARRACCVGPQNGTSHQTPAFARPLIDCAQPTAFLPCRYQCQSTSGCEPSRPLTAPAAALDTHGAAKAAAAAVITKGPATPPDTDRKAGSGRAGCPDGGPSASGAAADFCAAAAGGARRGACIGALGARPVRLPRRLAHEAPGLAPEAERAARSAGALPRCKDAEPPFRPTARRVITPTHRQ